jgi:small subunit ribosomal protein S20
MAADTETKKKKRPTAQKRMLQNEKRRQRNKTLKSQFKTSIRQFEESLKTGDQDKVNDRLKKAYSMADKTVKQGIYKLNKASRIKSRLSAKAAKA